MYRAFNGKTRAILQNNAISLFITLFKAYYLYMKRINGLLICINEIKLKENKQVINIDIDLSKNKTVYNFSGNSKGSIISDIIDFNGLESDTLDKVISYLEIALKGL